MRAEDASTRDVAPGRPQASGRNGNVGARQPPPLSRITADAWAPSSCWPSKPNANASTLTFPPTKRALNGPVLGVVVVFHSLGLIFALGRRLPGACGYMLTSAASQQLDDHLGRQRVLPVGDKQPGGGLVHAALDEPCAQLVVCELGPPRAHDWPWYSLHRSISGTSSA